MVVAVGVLLEPSCCGDTVYSNSWAVEIGGGDAEADSIARKHGFTNLGRVGSLEGVYHFVHRPSPARSRRSLTHKHRDLMAEDLVMFAEQQVLLKRVKRYSPPSDAKWPQQWYLHRKNHHDMNVQLAWEQDIIGRGAVVSILDDGIEHTHPDLHDNYDSLASYDFNSHDADPFPRYDISNENKHGTRCAGEVAANKNGKCGVGAAYGARVGGVRMLDGEVSDVVEASSLSLNPQHIDIYSSSWGPSDDGMTVDGPGKLAKKAFLDGVTKGRQGLGSIFVWAAGNGGRYGDSCNCDGYAVSPYTISVGSASERDDMPWYAEVCSSTLASTYSSGDNREKQIVSTDLHHMCTLHHTGTSASAPLAAGILALALEANRNLTWRDVQYLLVYTSNPAYPKDKHWLTNGAGLKVSHQYGFGIINAAAVVNRARYWTTVPPQYNCTIDATPSKQTVQSGHPLVVTIDASGCPLVYLEHTQVVTSLSLPSGNRGSVTIKLISPQGTESTLLPYRKRDYHSEGFHQWPFMTVQSWGENPRGIWKFRMEGLDRVRAVLDSLQLVLYGTKETHVSVRSIPSECHPECQGGCAKPGAKFCDACKHFRMAASLECVERCPEGTYTNYHMCRSCPPLCAECRDNSTCIRCRDGALKVSTGVCTADCPELTFAAPNGSCLPCHHSCLSCSGVGETSCTECPGQFQLQNGACVLRSDCPEGEYFDGRALECRLCHKSCAECSGKEADQCAACFTGYALQDGECLVDVRSSRNCSSGRYYDDGAKQCRSCPTGCAKCSDEITCTACDQGHFLQTQRVGGSQEETRLCVARCTNGFYGDLATHSCQPCPSYCNTCESPDSCTSCAFNFTRPVDGQCPQPCHDEHYFDFPTKQCQPCVENCLHCVNADACLACQSGYFLSPKGTCVSSCPDHMITNQLSGTCVDTSCHTSCSTCYGPEANQCMSCHGGLIFHDNSCLENCPQHTYFNGSSCLHCHDTCTSCGGPAANNCLSCPPGKVLDHFHCISSCPPSSFTSSERECLACPLNCINCSSVDSCKDCEHGYLKLLVDSTCVGACPPGHVQSDTECHPCPSNCKRCTDPLSCSKCWDDYALYEPDNSCLKTCPDGYYVSEGKCAACSHPCSSCDGSPNRCTECARDFAMHVESGLCRRCCSRDERERHPCCDCDKSDQKCVLTDDPFPKSAGSSSSAAPIAIIVAISLLAVLVVAIMVAFWMYKSRQFQKSYISLPAKDDPLVVSDDSESEAELYTNI